MLPENPGDFAEETKVLPAEEMKLRLLKDGKLAISGPLSHHSKNGDGIRGRIVSSRSGLAGEWTVKLGKQETKVAGIEVKKGDTIDFITDSIASEPPPLATAARMVAGGMGSQRVSLAGLVALRWLTMAVW